MRDLDGYVVVVTGASTGLGRAIAVECATRGARAVIVNFAHNQEDAEKTAEQVRAAGAEAPLAEGDVGDDAGCRAIAASAESYGRINALFNNAGVTKQAGNHSRLDALQADDFHRIYRVNVVGAFQMVRACRSLLEAAPMGAVVNTSSIGGSVGIGSSIAYVASKGALNTMTLSLARALAPKIRVNAISPGFMNTPWFGKQLSTGALGRLRESMAASTALKVASEAEDIAGAAVFLASPAARHITGEILLADAGLHLNYTPLALR